MDFELAIHGATVVTSDRRRKASVYVAAGRIAEVSAARLPAAREIDAGGLCLIPGAIDGHVHFMDPSETDREDFTTGSAAAACGGVTTVIEHTHTNPLRTAEEFHRKAAHVAGRSLVDYGLGAHVWPDLIDSLPELWQAGAAYLKMFTCTTHGVPGLSSSEILGAFRKIAEFRGLALLHCEDESITRANLEEVRAWGDNTGAILPAWRTREAELVAVNSVCLLARLAGARAAIAHASYPAVVDLIAQHRAAGGDLWIEACPQYLYLREADALEHGAFRKFTPPARARSASEAEAMWRQVASGPVTHVSSDHAPSTRLHKERGIWDAPFGLPGVETALTLLLNGVGNGYLSLERVVELTSETPARLYGLAPRKGGLWSGADADLVLVDLEASRTISDDQVISKAGWSPFAGTEVHGLPVMTFVRGRLVAEYGKPVAEPGWGQFLPGPGAPPAS